jgi:hypothetical protein
MGHRRIAAGAAALLVLALPSLASAASRMSISGTWDDCNFGPAVKTAGPNLIVSVGITENFYGPMAGTYAGTERDVVYADGSASFKGAGTFTGSVDGIAGTASYTYEGQAPAGQPFSATWTLVGQSGDLAGAHGHGTFGGTFTGVSDPCDAGLYAGDYAGSIVAGS